MSKLRIITSLMFYALLIGGLYITWLHPEEVGQQALTESITNAQDETNALQERIKALTVSAPTVELPEQLLWRASESVDAELLLQDVMVSLVNNHPLSLITFGTTELSQDTSQKIVSLELELEGPLSAYYAYLAELENHIPRIAISTLQVRPGQGFSEFGGEEMSVYVRMLAWAFWDTSK